jgi:hypothetical protein
MIDPVENSQALVIAYYCNAATVEVEQDAVITTLANMSLLYGELEDGSQDHDFLSESR